LNIKGRYRRALLGATGIVIAAGLAGFAAPAAAQQDGITFGTALSRTGKMSPGGSRVKEGYDLYVKQINERGGIKVGNKTYRMAIKYYDDQSDATPRSSFTRSGSTRTASSCCPAPIRAASRLRPARSPRSSSCR
jgi:hypothetical protein